VPAPRRNTKYATEIATARIPTGTTGNSSLAIERIFVKHLQQEEIRFSWWEGARLMPRPLDLPEAELLPLMREAISAGVFSPEFVQELGQILRGAPTDAENGRLRTFQVFARYADSDGWEHLGVWELEFVPRIGERIARDVGDHGHAFRVVSLHHPEGGAVDGPDLFVVDMGPIVEDMRRLFNECEAYVSSSPPPRDDSDLPPGHKSAPDA
jgi:hypothetical protein